MLMMDNDIVKLILAILGVVGPILGGIALLWQESKKQTAQGKATHDLFNSRMDEMLKIARRLAALEATVKAEAVADVEAAKVAKEVESGMALDDRADAAKARKVKRKAKKK